MHASIRPALFAAALALIAASSPACAEGMVLKFHETQTIATTVPNQYQIEGKKTQMTTTTANVDNHYVVTLEPDSLSIVNGDNTDFYDFAAKRYYRIDAAKKTYYSYPLQAVPLSNHILKDRLAKTAASYELATQSGILVRLPTGITVDVNPIHIDLDSAYGSASDVASNDFITAATASGKTLFSTKYGALASFSLSDTAVPEPLRKTYNRFLTYGPPLHPKVEAAMDEGGKVFAALDYAANDHMGKKVASNWTFDGSAPAAEAPKLPVGFTQIFNDDADINTSFMTSLQPGPTVDNFSAKVKGYIQQNDSMRAVLSLQEMMDTLPKTVTDPQRSLTDQVLRITNDPETLNIEQILTVSQTTLSAVKKAQDALKAAKAKARDYGYFLDVYRARSLRQELRLTGMDEKRYALSILMDTNALIVNPWLAAAYGDLGDAQYEGGDGLFAFLCWENAQRLKPDLAGALIMNGLKARAEKDFPEYF